MSSDLPPLLALFIQNHSQLSLEIQVVIRLLRRNTLALHVLTHQSINGKYLHIFIRTLSKRFLTSCLHHLRSYLPHLLIRPVLQIPKYLGLAHHFAAGMLLINTTSIAQYLLGVNSAAEGFAGVKLLTPQQRRRFRGAWLA